MPSLWSVRQCLTEDAACEAAASTVGRRSHQRCDAADVPVLDRLTICSDGPAGRKGAAGPTEPQLMLERRRSVCIRPRHR